MIDNYFLNRNNWKAQTFTDKNIFSGFGTQKKRKRKSRNVLGVSKKQVFHLPIEQAVYVPSTTHTKVIPKHKQIQRVNLVRKYLAQKFGGYTSVKAIGGYYSDKTRKVIKEPVYVVSSYSTKQAYRKHKKNLMKKVQGWGKNWKQESMGYEQEGDMYYISPSKNKR